MTLIVFFLLLGKAIYCAVAAMPTRFFVETAEKLKSIHTHRVQHILEAALAKSTKGIEFHQDESFISQGVGLAADYEHRSLFIAERDGQKTRAAILPFSAIRGFTAGSVNQNGFFDRFIDLTIEGDLKIRWRLLCGEDPRLIAQITATLTNLQAA